MASSEPPRAIERATLVQTVTGLSPSDLARVVALIDRAARHVSRHGTVPEQARDLISWAESSAGPGLEAIQRALEQLSSGPSGEEHKTPVTPITIAYLGRRGVSLAMVAVAALLISAVVGYLAISKFLAIPSDPLFSDNEYGIVVTEFAENAVIASSADRTVTQVLVDTMGDLLNSTPVSNHQAVVVKPHGQVIPAVRGHEAALQLARRSKARIVVWGWYSRDAQNSLIRVNVDLVAPDSAIAPFVQNLDDPRVTPTNYIKQFGSILIHPRTDEVFNLAFTVSSAQEASASAALIIGFIAYTHGEFDRAESLLSTLAEKNKRVNPLVRSYTHFLRGNIKLARMVTEKEGEPDMRRNAISDFFAANEYLQVSQEYSRVLKAKILNNIGAILISLDDYEHADAFVTESLRQSADNATAHLNKGRILLATAGYDDRPFMFTRRPLLSEDPEGARPTAEADGVASMEKALSINPNLLTAHLWLAKVAIHRNDLKKATEQLHSVFAAFKKLDPQHVSLPDQVFIQFMQEFGPEFSADLVEPKDRERVLKQLTAYLAEQKRLYVMFSTMNPRAMAMAGANAATARSAIARLQQGKPPAINEKSLIFTVPPLASAADPDTLFREKVQEAISGGRRQDAIQLLSKKVGQTGNFGARYVLGKLLFEAGDRRGAYAAVSQAIDEEINDFSLKESAWTVKFTDSERRTTYADFVDVLIQSIDQQVEFESAVANLIERIHLLKAKPIRVMLSLRRFTLPEKQRLVLLTNLGGALAKEQKLAEAADVFAEASPYADGYEKLRLMFSELKMRASASQSAVTLGQLLDAVEKQRENLRPPLPQHYYDYLDLITALWRCELALRAGLDEDASWQKALASATYSNGILADYYRARFALRRGDEAEWLKLYERSVDKNDAYHSPPAFNEVEIAPQEAGAIFESMLRDLVAYYRRSGDFEKIGYLLFENYGENYLHFEQHRLKVLQHLLLR